MRTFQIRKLIILELSSEKDGLVFYAHSMYYPTRDFEDFKRTGPVFAIAQTLDFMRKVEFIQKY